MLLNLIAMDIAESAEHHQVDLITNGKALDVPIPLPGDVIEVGNVWRKVRQRLYQYVPDEVIVTLVLEADPYEPADRKGEPMLPQAWS